MALQVWLPLNGDLRNNGITDVSITNNGAVVNASGKIGSCYSFSSKTIVATANATLNNQFSTKASCAFWIKLSSSHNAYAQAFTYGTVGTSWNNITFGIDINGSGVPIGNVSNGSSNTNCSFVSAIKDDKWHHLAFTYDNGVMKSYIDGLLKNTVTTSYVPAFANCTVVSIGGNSSELLKNADLMNDVRLYSHALSQKEVAEIAKGLVLHYPLNDQYNASNLVYNGFGEYGSDGWSGTTVSTSDLPSDSNVKATFTNGETINYIPINAHNTFTVSCYLKTAGATSGTTYPSIKPYDADKKFIAYYNCASGFSSAWKTTLSQPLNTGDTVIHATDLSSWSTATNNYYYHVAIFGYKDSTGYVYPDMEYTQDSPVFGSYSDKSKINKTNNTITLNSAYTGKPRPAGTVICQATEGGTYYYPFGGIAISTLTDWTAKTATINFGNDTRLRNAKYITWLNYSGAKYAGIKITDDTWGNSVVYDISGFGYNGTVNNGSIVSTDSPRYNRSIVLDGVSQSVQMPNLSTVIMDGSFTANIWFKKVTDGWGTKSYETIFGGPSGFEIEAKNGGTNSPVIRAYSWGGSTFSYTLDVWHMLTMVRTTEDTKFYLDGELKLTGTAATIPSGNYFLGSWSDTTHQNYKGQLSDFRLYATALTADQVKELYNAPISLANNGTLMANEFNEI